MSKLSESYTSTVKFGLVFTNVPEGLLLKKASEDEIEVKLRAVGFQFLKFNINKKNIGIDLSNVQKTESKYFIPPEVYRRQIDRQLNGSMSLVEVNNDSLFFAFQEVVSKQVEIEPRIHLNLGQNYLLDGDLLLKPKKITITGPKTEIDTIKSVRTAKLDLTDLTSDFIRKVGLYKAPELKNTSFSSSSVTIKGNVARFSEKIIEVPITVINLPKKTGIRTFPDKVSILCKAKISELKELDSYDFQVIADYGTIGDENSKATIILELRKKPKELHSAVLLENQVEYILRRE